MTIVNKIPEQFLSKALNLVSLPLHSHSSLSSLFSNLNRWCTHPLYWNSVVHLHFMRSLLLLSCQLLVALESSKIFCWHSTCREVSADILRSVSYLSRPWCSCVYAQWCTTHSDYTRIVLCIYFLVVSYTLNAQSAYFVYMLYIVLESFYIALSSYILLQWIYSIWRQNDTIQ